MHASMRAFVVLSLACLSGVAFRWDFATDAEGLHHYQDFPASALLGTFSTAFAIRLVLPLPRRPFAEEARMLAWLFGVGLVAFQLGRRGLLELYAVLAPRLPIGREWATEWMALSFALLLLGLVLASWGWSASLRRTALPLRPGASLLFAVATLAVLPSAAAVLLLADEPTDLPNVVISGLPPFFTVVYVAAAARLGVRPST